ADIWRFLFSIADLAGERWGKLARDAARAITLNASVPGSSEQFRNALQRALTLAHDRNRLAIDGKTWGELVIDQIADGNLRMSSKGLCQLLQLATGKEMNLKPTVLADRLKPFDVRPGPINVGGKRIRGYKEEDLLDLLHRYGAGDGAEWDG